MLKVTQRRNDVPIEISHNLFERFACLRRRRRQLRTQLSMRNLRQRRQLTCIHALAKVCDPVDQLVPVPAKLLGCHALPTYLVAGGRRQDETDIAVGGDCANSGEQCLRGYIFGQHGHRA